MRRVFYRAVFLAFAMSLVRAAEAPPSANPPPAAGAAAPAKPVPVTNASTAVMLPPMLVEESTTGVPWLYANVGGTEVLSRCSSGVTRELVGALQGQMQILHALVPDLFLPPRDVPAVLVLYSQDLDQAVSEEIKRDLEAREKAEAKTRPGEPPRAVNIAPGMRLADRDMHATIAYVDEARFDGNNLTITPAHIRYLLQGRVPELPGWLLTGFERMLRTTDLRDKPITLLPMIWIDPAESEAFLWDPARPRAILPASELFASDTWAEAEKTHARRAEVRAATQELFVRWAILQGGATRAAFWKFVARAAEAPATEEMFEACFGFDYAELRDRLSDYLPKAVTETKWIDPGDLPSVPRVEVEKASPDEIARVRGEWERLAIGHVQKRFPQFREPYIAQARRTLHRVYDVGDREPRLLATMGLCEIDASNDAGARQFLEPAVLAGVVRPRAYYELARLRFADVRRGAPDTQSFSAVELAPVFGPLRRALTQTPPLPETYSLLAMAWARCDSAPDDIEWRDLKDGARLFPRRGEVALPVARALARHGRPGEAAVVLDACADYVLDPTLRAEIKQFRATLK